MSKLRLVLALGILPSLCLSADASGCRQVTVYQGNYGYGHAQRAVNVVYPFQQQHYFQATTYQPVYYTPYVTGGGYDAASEVSRLRLELEIQQLKATVNSLKLGQAPAAPYIPQQSTCEQKLQRLEQQMQQLEQRMGQPPAPKQMSPAGHSQTQPAVPTQRKAGGFTMFDDSGGTRPFSAAEEKRMLEQVEKGHMPPKVALSDAEKAAFKHWVAGVNPASPGNELLIIVIRKCASCHGP